MKYMNHLLDWVSLMKHCFNQCRLVSRAIGLVFIAGTAEAEELLIIDLTVANRITITSTNGLSSADISGQDALGIYFADFYSGGENVAAGAFGAVDTSIPYTLTTIDPSLGIEPAADYSQFNRAGGDDPGLNLFDWTTYSDIDFITGVLAFQGSTTWDLDPGDYNVMLAGGNRSGDLYFPADDVTSVTTATVIGQYSVLVPETATEFEIWASGQGLDGSPGKEDGPNDDPDKDGKSNFYEYSFDGNPLSGRDMGKVFLVTNDGVDDKLILTIAVRSGTPVFNSSPSPTATHDGVIYTVEGSVGLSDFTSSVSVVATVTAGLPSPNAGYEYRSFCLDGSTNFPDTGFLRASIFKEGS